MSHAKFNVGIKAIMQNSEGKILTLKAHDNGPMAGYNDMPGGRIEETEIGVPFTEILQREIEEELGDIQYKIEHQPVTAVSWTWPNGQDMTFIYYLAKYEFGDLIISDEHWGHEWIEPTIENIDKYFTTYHNAALKQYLQN